MTLTDLSKLERVVLSGGGTSGHISPALAVAEYLRAANPRMQISFIGTESGLESRIVPRAGFNYLTTPAAPLIWGSPLKLLRAYREFRRGKRVCREHLKAERPQVVIGMGGYVCSPVVAAAASLGIPLVLHEQNAFPGRSNRLFARSAATVCISYPEAERVFPRGVRIVLTGNPVRPDFFTAEREASRSTLGLDTAERLILVSGGSLGARRLNKTVIEWLAKRRGSENSSPRVIIAAGARLYEECAELKKTHDVGSELEVKPYIDDMPRYMAASDLIISRAGAMTCAEICAVGRPSLLIPYPQAASDHQTFNARQLVDEGAALMVPDADFTPEKLEAVLAGLLTDDSRLEEMGRRAHALAEPDAVEKIAAEVVRLV